LGRVVGRLRVRVIEAPVWSRWSVEEGFGQQFEVL